MSISLSQSYTAIGPGNTASFLATGGIPPYTYQVAELGVGGTINTSTGLYTSPSSVNSSPNTTYDTILAVDVVGATASRTILVGSVISLFCDVIQTSMNLQNGRVYEWNQKGFQPTDSGLYIAISIDTCRVIANTLQTDPTTGLDGVAYVNMWAMLGVDIISRGPEARDQKELVVAALNSIYSQQQQQKNAFLIGRTTTAFTNLSRVDGAAIPYRFRLSVGIQYTIKNTLQVPYYDNFSIPDVDVNP